LNKLKLLLNTALIVFLFASYKSAHADAKLQLGEGVNLLAVNGKEVSTDSFFPGKIEYKLRSGQNQILVNYTAEVKKGSDTELEQSKLFVLLFEANSAQLVLKAPEIEQKKELKAFEDNKSWILKTATGKSVKFKANILDKSGFQLSRDYEYELEKFNKSNKKAALPRIKDVKENIENPTKEAKIEDKNMAMEMLIYWYNQADQNTRNSFKDLIKNK